MKMHEEGEVSIRQKLPKPLLVFFLVAFCLDLLALVCEAYARYHLHLGWPYNQPLLDAHFLGDLHAFDQQLPFLHTAAFLVGDYPLPFAYPMAVVPFYGIFFALPHEDAWFTLCVLGLALLGAILLYRALRQRTTLAAWRCALISGGAVPLSFPLFFELKQGNMELFVCLFVALGIWCVYKKRLHAGAAFLGIAAAMKIFPFVYFGLFLTRRRLPALITGAMAAVIMTLASMYYACTSIAIALRGSQQAGRVIEGGLLSLVRQLGFDHSLFVFVKLANRAFFNHQSFVRPHVMYMYLAVVGLAGIALYFLRIRHLPFVNQVCCFCVVSILFPPISYDYTLIHIYVPWVLCVLYAAEMARRREPGLIPVFVCLAIVTSIQTEVIIYHHMIAAQIKAIAFVILLAIMLRRPFHWPRVDDLDALPGRA